MKNREVYVVIEGVWDVKIVSIHNTKEGAERAKETEKEKNPHMSPGWWSIDKRILED